MATKEDRDLYARVFNLIESINLLEPRQRDATPSTPLVGAMLETITNRWLISLLRVVRDETDPRLTSQTLSRRSSLFDKLVLMKGKSVDWVLRLHTYSLTSTKGSRTTNLGESVQDDEENTHIHRWRLSSRFVTGGFTNVTWDTDDHNLEGQGTVLNKYMIPSTKNTSGDSRKSTLMGKSRVSVRRTEFYHAGDVIVYPILDPHSVNSALGPLTGTTMTLAHTGLGILKDSYFFAERDVETVELKLYNTQELTDAINMTITRLQLVDLNHHLARKNEAFRHLNSFETELLPRLAEFILLLDTTPEKEKDDIDIDKVAASLDLERADAELLLEMDTDSLAALIVESQRFLYKQDFAKSGPDLLDKQRGFTVPKLTKTALKDRSKGTPPVNRIGGPKLL